MGIKEKIKRAYKIDISKAPEDWKSKHPVHPLSKTPGGAAVYVEYKTNELKVYENVKYPDAYIKRIWSMDVNERIKDIWTIV
jgi:hypothetical protein